MATELLNREYEFATSVLNLMELRSVLTKKKRVEQDRVEGTLDDIRERIVVYTPDDTDLVAAYKLQRETLLYPMDCVFLALADDLDAQAVTFDRELIDAGATPPEELL